MVNIPGETRRGSACQKRSPKAAFQAVKKTSESSRGLRPSRTSNRARRHVRWMRDDFCGGKSHFPEQKSLPCRFCARGFRRNPSKICKAETPKGFQVSPKAKLPTAKSKILTRHRGGGTWRGSLLPRPPACQKDFFDKLRPPHAEAVFALRALPVRRWSKRSPSSW